MNYCTHLRMEANMDNPMQAGRRSSRLFLYQKMSYLFKSLNINHF